MYDLNIDYWQLMNTSVNKVKHMYYNKWLSGIDEHYMAYAKVIYDMILMKDDIYVNDFDFYECDRVIRHLCTI